ncbi:FEZ-like protein [Blomia tropicalis]|nr:FEZ-like protein [Blomia tropicalis]
MMDIVSIPPLASIDETDDVTIDSNSSNQSNSPLNCGFINSSSNRNLIILTNGSSSTASIEPSLGIGNILSPGSDDFGGLTTMTMTSNALLTQDDELGDTGFFSSSMSYSSKRSSIDSTSLQQHLLQMQDLYENEEDDNDNDDIDEQSMINEILLNVESPHTSLVMENETVTLCQSSELSNSLEDLVNSFDDKVKNCLHNYKENVSNLAPVQIRSTEEVLKDRPAWWTLTGNYGNVLPFDWTKVNVHDPDHDGSNMSSLTCDSLQLDDIDEASEDEKLKHLIDSCLEMDCVPIKSAEEVLEEIDAIMSGKIGTLNSQFFADQCTISSSDNSLSLCDVPVVRRVSFYRFSLEKLKSLTIDQLQDLNEDLECKVQKHSEALVKELAKRDELEFEKEVKNTFISLMLSIQNRRKEYIQQCKKNCGEPSIERKYRYLTTVIPFDRNVDSDRVPVLQSLIKILRAMLDDSPTVPTLLTDHILKYICPADYSTLSTASVPIDDKGIHYNGPFGSLNNAVNFTHLTTSLNNRVPLAELVAP